MRPGSRKAGCYLPGTEGKGTVAIRRVKITVPTVVPAGTVPPSTGRHSATIGRPVLQWPLYPCRCWRTVILVVRGAPHRSPVVSCEGGGRSLSDCWPVSCATATVTMTRRCV